MQRLGLLPLRLRDPGLVSLRRAGRGALVISVTLIVALRVTRDTNVILFLIFGLFSLLILADFGGPPRRRAAAFLIVTGIGAALVAVATLLSPLPWLAALLMLVVAFGVAGLLLWPRGARTDFRHALAALYRAVAAYMDESFDRVLGLNGGTRKPNRRPAVEARDLAGEAFDVLLNERAQKPDPPERRAALLASGSHAILIADLLNVVADMGYQAAGCPDGARVVNQQKQAVVASLRALADRLAGGGEVPLQRVPSAELHAAEVDCLRRWGGDPSRAEGRAAIAVVSAAEWLRRLDQLVADLAEPVNDVARVSRAPVSAAALAGARP